MMTTCHCHNHQHLPNVLGTAGLWNRMECEDLFQRTDLVIHLLRSAIRSGNADIVNHCCELEKMFLLRVDWMTRAHSAVAWSLS